MKETELEKLVKLPIEDVVELVYNTGMVLEEILESIQHESEEVEFRAKVLVLGVFQKLTLDRAQGLSQILVEHHFHSSYGDYEEIEEEDESDFSVDPDDIETVVEKRIHGEDTEEDANVIPFKQKEP